MKKFLGFYAVLFVVTISAAAAAPEKKSVMDYFEAIAAADESYPFLDQKERLSFPVKDLKNGYLTVSGPFDGGMAFVLFRGKEQDLVVMETSECGPGCRYGYTALIFANGKFLRKESLAKVYPLADVQKKSRALVVKEKGRQSPPRTWPAEANFRLILPKEGKITKVYVFAPSASTRYDETYFDVGTMNWDPVAFRFKYRPSGRAKDLGPLDLY